MRKPPAPKVGNSVTAILPARVFLLATSIGKRFAVKKISLFQPNKERHRMKASPTNAEIDAHNAIAYRQIADKRGTHIAVLYALAIGLLGGWAIFHYVNL